MFSDTFAGTAPASVHGFIAAQLIGCACAIFTVRTLYPDVASAEAGDVILPYREEALLDGDRSIRRADARYQAPAVHISRAKKRRVTKSHMFARIM